jgi:hypothetical protein
MLQCEFTLQSADVTSLSFVERAGHWFLRSGIQEPDGGVARYYLAAEGRNLPVSNEITGYSASAYSYLYSLTGERDYRRAAERAARFLARAAWNNDLETFPFENADPLPPAYFFDCGIIVRGLLAVWRINGEEELIDVALRAGRAMARDFLTPDVIHPILDLPSKKPRPYEKRWSKEPGCFQLKSAMAWYSLARATGDNQFLKPYERALELALANGDDFLPGAEAGADVMDRLHAFSYFLEGLMPVAGRPLCRAAIQAGLRRAALLRDQIAPEFARSDVYAQILRARLYADALGACPLDERAARHEAAAIESFQEKSPDRRLDGGFCFGRRGGELMPFANPVSTAFCLQALAQWRQREAGGFHPSLDALI